MILDNADEQMTPEQQARFKEAGLICRQVVLGGSFTLTSNGYTTRFIPHDASSEDIAATIERELNAA